MSDHLLNDERHNVHRIGWLRAAVLGANDGIVSTASLLIGMTAASAGKPALLLTGIAALAAGAMSMAAGEYISVSSQRDTEKADLDKESKALRDNPEAERIELAQIYESRGLTPDLSLQVAKQLMEKDALGAHARDELGISHIVHSNPVQAAWSSALSFSVGAALPVFVVLLVPGKELLIPIAISALLSLALLGAVAAKAGGASISRSVARVVFWGIAAMVVTAIVGTFFEGAA